MKNKKFIVGWMVLATVSICLLIVGYVGRTESVADRAAFVAPVSTELAPTPTPTAAPTTATPVVKPSPNTVSKPKAKTTFKPRPKPVVRPVVAPSPTRTTSVPRTVNLYPVTALYSQATIDRGKLVTWMTSPTCLLAGHDTRGWYWLDTIKTGTIVNVKAGPCAGKYKIVGHKWQSVKGGPIPSWMSNYDLVLQTCTGSSGMGFSTAVKI